MDQNFGAGEKFDEFRFPLLAFKFLYNIGNVGESFSNVSIEPFYTPRWFSGTKSLLLEDGWRMEYQIKNCVGPRLRPTMNWSGYSTAPAEAGLKPL